MHIPHRFPNAAAPAPSLRQAARFLREQNLFRVVGPVLAGVLLAVGIGRFAPSHTPAPADLFMRSIVTRGGDLGWRQLCEGTKAQMPLALIHAQAEAKRIAEAPTGLKLSYRFVGAHRQSESREVRDYLVTGRFAQGQVLQRAYHVHTTAGGCVESVE